MFLKGDLSCLDCVNGLPISPIIVPRSFDRVDVCTIKDGFTYSIEHCRTRAVLLLHPFIMGCLEHYQVSFLAINVYRFMTGFYVLYKILRFPELTAEDFAYYFDLRRKRKINTGFFALYPYIGMKGLINNVDNTSPF